MTLSSNTVPTPSPDVLAYLDIVQKVVGDDFLPRSYRTHLGDLTTIDHLIEVDKDEAHPLWWFLPPLLYDLFDEKLEFEWLRQTDNMKHSVVVIPPPFISILDQLQQELALLGVTSVPSMRHFSRQFIGLLYGGYPWFESYLRIYDANNLSDQQCAVLSVSSDTCDVPRTLEVFKKRRRNSYGQPLQMAFNDLPYPGVIRPFHSPARIETKRHMRAAKLG